MIDHLSIGAGDLARSRRFYDAVLAPLGFTCLSAGDDSLGYGTADPVFWVLGVARPVPADPASGLHICFVAPDPRAVDAFHAAALATGGGDNGAPGHRPDYSETYYAAFVTDPDGYRVEAHCEHQA
jgi:catechol 2,3-dioxygenase-like lactoylglutathione lyase family enzyme